MSDFMAVGANLSNPFGAPATDTRPKITIASDSRETIYFGAVDAFTSDDIAFEHISARLQEQLGLIYDPETGAPRKGREHDARNINLQIEDINRAHAAHKLSRQAHQERQAADSADGLTSDSQNAAALQRVQQTNVIRDTSTGNVSSLMIARKPNV